jgi:hypothetical protein
MGTCNFLGVYSRGMNGPPRQSGCKHPEKPCRPYGTRLSFPAGPALKRWAKLFRAYGAFQCPPSSATNFS